MNNYQHSISMKLELNEDDYKAIKSLEAICYEKQRTYLKLELDFKMHQRKNSIKNKIMTEFFYYENEILVLIRNSVKYVNQTTILYLSCL